MNRDRVRLQAPSQLFVVGCVHVFNAETFVSLSHTKRAGRLSQGGDFQSEEPTVWINRVIKTLLPSGIIFE